MKTLNKIIYLSLIALFIGIMAIPAISKADPIATVNVDGTVTITGHLPKLSNTLAVLKNDFVVTCPTSTDSFVFNLQDLTNDPSEAMDSISFRLATDPIFQRSGFNLGKARVVGFQAPEFSVSIQKTGTVGFPVQEGADYSVWGRCVGTTGAIDPMNAANVKFVP